MKKTYLIFGICAAMSLTSCGGGSSDSDSKDTDIEMSDDSSDEDDEDENGQSASEMLNEYKDMLEDYQNALAYGTEDEVAAMKVALDGLKQAASSELGGSELEAIESMALLALALENGEDIDLSSALESYSDLLGSAASMMGNEDAMEALEGASEAMEALEGASEAMEALENMPDMPDLDDY